MARLGGPPKIGKDSPPVGEIEPLAMQLGKAA